MSPLLLLFCQVPVHSLGEGGEGKLNDPCLRGVQNTVGEEEFFREGSHFANLDITPRNLQMGTVVKEKKKRLAKKKKFSPSGDR